MQRTLSTNDTRTVDQGIWLISVLLLIDSLHFVFARILLPYINPEVSAMYVQGAAAVIFGIYATVTGQLRWGMLRQHLWFFLGIGFLIGLSTDMNYTAIGYIDPGTASMLGKISTIFGVAFGLFWLGERFTTWQWLGAGLAIVGSFVVAYHPGGDLQSQSVRLGSLLVIVATLLYAVHTAMVKRYSSGIDFANFFFFRLLGTTAALLAIATVTHSLSWPTPIAWFWVVVTGVVDVLISRVLYYVALRRLNMSIHSLILTLSPVATILWSFFLFRTLPGLQQLIGGLTVMAGVLIVTWQQRR